MSKIQAIEYLENALYNCDNIGKIGIGLVQIVKEQIQSAIKELEEEVSDGK